MNENLKTGISLVAVLTGVALIFRGYDEASKSKPGAPKSYLAYSIPGGLFVGIGLVIWKS